MTHRQLKRLHLKMKTNVMKAKNSLDAVKKIAEKLECTTVSDFRAIVELTCEHVGAEAKTLPSEANNRPVAWVARYTTVFQKLIDDEGELERLIGQLREIIDICKVCDIGEVSFTSPLMAATHYLRHKYFPRVQRTLTPEQYFKLASKMAKDKKEFEVTQDGAIKYTVKDEEIGAIMILFLNLTNGTGVVASLYTLQNQRVTL